MSEGDGLEASRGYRGYVLFMLVAVYAFNFIDRQIVSILAIPIRTELQLSDTQLALMGGLAFASVYSMLAIPLARLADRRGRTWVITVALGVWSVFTALSGLATSFWQLSAARLGVGVGEAGGVAPSHALIADYFPPERRARALALYSFGIPIGSASGILLGGWIASVVDWRWAFIVVGLAGLILAPIFRLSVREPSRAAESGVPVGIGAVWRTLAAKPSFWLLSAGAASCSVMGYGLAFWLPSFFGRTYALTLIETSRFYGVLTLIGGLAGLWIGGVLADRLALRSRRAYPLVPAVAFVIAVPLYAAGVMMPTPIAAFLCFLVPTALALSWLGPIVAAVQNLVPAGMRATASATFLLFTNLIGIGGGTLMLGVASDALRAAYGAQSLRFAILGGLVVYLISATLFWLASRHIERDWHLQ